MASSRSGSARCERVSLDTPRSRDTGRVRIDLHTHSTVSDGTERPAEVMRAAYWSTRLNTSALIMSVCIECVMMPNHALR